MSLRPSALRARRQNAPRPAHKSAEGYKQWLRGRPCACEGKGPSCEGKIVAAHVDYAGKGTDDAKGAGTKVADRWCIPLSDGCHRLQHLRGWPWFDTRVLGGTSRGMMLAEAYWNAWPGKWKWTQENGDGMAAN